VIEYLASAEVGEQTRLASSASIPGGTLSKFKSGCRLTRDHFLALELALASRVERNAA